MIVVDYIIQWRKHTCNVNKFWLTNQANPALQNRRMERKERTKAMSTNKEESIGIRKIQPNVANGEHCSLLEVVTHSHFLQWLSSSAMQYSTCEGVLKWETLRNYNNNLNANAIKEKQRLDNMNMARDFRNFKKLKYNILITYKLNSFYFLNSLLG